MVPLGHLVEAGQQALVLAAAVSLPVVGIAAVVGLLVAAVQAASQIQDPTISHLPRMLAVIAGLVALGPWMGHQIAAFAERTFTMVH
ncbi:MAG TPA: flagellar biosynthetic protein FliQ [Polyangiaceae bacterium]|nr:flagellar biosynthetic protein FliQ [Polyangiaceae bacterium]